MTHETTDEARDRVVRDKIGRLRNRVRVLETTGADIRFVTVLKGILDLLADEL